MAFETGTVGGATALLSALTTFATANGWTMHDDLTSTDKVLTSVGVDSKVKMFYRIFTNDAPANFFANAPMKPDRSIPGLLVNGYHAWNNVSHVGTNAFGQLGPFVWSQQAGSGTPRLHRYSRTKPFNAADAASSWWSNWVNTTANNVPICGGFDGASMFWGNGTQNVINYADLTTMNNLSSATIAGASNMGYTAPAVWVHNAATDIEEMYFLTGAASGVNQFQKINTRTRVVTLLANPAFGSQLGGFMVWDGGNFIYASPGNGGTVFKRYDIAGNSWTTLAVLPAARAAAFANVANGWFSMQNAVYLPAAATGLAEDIIMAPMATSVATIHIYLVTTGTWTGTQTAPFTWTNSGTNITQGLYWDGRDELLAHNNIASGFIYGTKLSGPFGTYTALGQQSTGSEACGMVFNHYTCKVRSGGVTSTTYWFSGDADGIMVVVKYNSRYYWMYFGRYYSFSGSVIASVTGTATSGSNVTINVDSSAGIDPGSRLLIIDPSTGLHEVISVDAVPTGTSIKATIQNSYTAGSKVGADPAPFGCMSSGGWVTTALGPEGHFEADQLTQFYFYEGVSSTTVTSRNDPNARGVYHMTPLRIYQPTSGLRNHEDIGSIKRLFLVSTTGLAAEDVITFEGKQYKVFTASESTTAGSDSRRFAIPMS